MAVATQLIAEVKAIGADTTEAQMLAMSAASDASAVSLGTVVTASTALSRNMAELSAMTAEGAASFGTFAAAEDTTDASTAALNAQFAAMRARFAEVSAQADIEGASLLRSAEASRVSAGMHAKFGAALQSVGNVAKDVIVTLGKIALVTGAIAAIIGIVAVKAAGDFQQGLNRLVTGAGDVTDNMQKMGQAILGISADTGVLTGPLLSAMYQIISANQRGAQALNTLTVAAKGAQIEQANIVDVAKAVTTAMTDYVKMHLTAAQAMNGYVKAVSLGKLSLEELATSLSPLLPITANLKIHFADVAAAMSTMTNAGLPAERAATSLRFLFQSLENPTKKASTAMVEWGLNSVKLADEMKVSLPKALQMVYDAAKKAGPEGSVPFNRAVSDMIGGQRSLQSFLSLTGSHMKTFTDDAQAVARAMGVSKDVVQGWDLAQKNLNVQWDRAKAAVMGLLITLGTALLPVLTNLLAQITPIIKSFTDWISHGDNLKNTLAQVGDILAPLISACKDTYAEVQPLVQQFITWAIKNDVAGKSLAVLKGVVLLFADTLRFLVPVMISVITAVVEFVSTLIDRLQPAIQGATTFIQTHWEQIAAITQGIWSTISGIIEIAWNIIKGIILVGIDVLSGQWGKAGKDMQDAWSGIWDGIKRVVIGAMHTVLGVLALLPGGLGDMAKRALHELDKLTNAVTTSTENMKKAALQHSIQMQQGVVNSLKVLAAGVEQQMKNAKDASTKHALQMKLDAINAAIATNEGVLKAYQAMANGVNSTTGKMAANVSNHFSLMQQQATQKARQMAADLVGHSIIPDMVNSIVSIFATLPGRALSAVSSLAGRLAGFFGGLAGSAFSWGLHIIQNLASGILSGIGAAISAAQRVAAAVAGILKHSKPTMGPLADDDLWGAHLVDNFVAGIMAGAPRVQSALAGLFGGTGNIGISHSFSGSSGVPFAFGGGGSPIVINKIYVQSPDMYFDGKLVTRQLGPHIADEMWGQSGKRRPV